MVGVGQRAVVERMKQSGKMFDGNLAFFNNWTLFWTTGKLCSTYEGDQFCLSLMQHV